MGKSKEGVEKHLQGGFRFTVGDNDVSKCHLIPLKCDLMQQTLSLVVYYVVMSQITKFMGNMHTTKMSFFKLIFANILPALKEKRKTQLCWYRSQLLIQVEQNDEFNSWWLWLQKSPDVKSRQTYQLILAYQIQDKCHLTYFFNLFLWFYSTLFDHCFRITLFIIYVFRVSSIKWSYLSAFTRCVH